jgi:hypothetical protein
MACLDYKLKDESAQCIDNISYYIGTVYGTEQAYYSYTIISITTPTSDIGMYGYINAINLRKLLLKYGVFLPKT